MTDNYDYGRLDYAKEVNHRDPFIGEGRSKLVVHELVPFSHTTHGPSVRCTFEVVASECHPVGSRVCTLWFLVKPSKFPNQPNDSDRFADFVKRLKGSPVGHPVGRDCAALLRDRVAEQLARGMVIDVFGVNTSKNAAKPYIDTNWATVAQTPDEIRASRARLDAASPLAPVAAPAYAPPTYAPPTYPQTQIQPAPYTPPAGGILSGLPNGTGGGNGTPW